MYVWNLSNFSVSQNWHFLVILATFGIEIVIRWWKIFFWSSFSLRTINRSELFVCTIHKTLILLGEKPLNRDYSKKLRWIFFSLSPFKPDFHAISKKVQHSYSTFRLDLPFDFEQSAAIGKKKTFVKLSTLSWGGWIRVSSKSASIVAKYTKL